MRSIFVLFFINLIYTDAVKNNCIPLKDCKAALKYIRFIKNHKDILRNAHCGFDNNKQPKVHCPKFKDCFLFEKCPLAVEVAKSNRFERKKKEIELLRKNICNDKSGKYIKCIKFSKQILKRSLANSCKQEPILKPRVVNGKNADIHDFPWMALLEYKDKNVECAGSLINSNFVITAAHCIQNKNEDYLNKINFVTLGVHDKKNTISVAKYEIETVYIHPKYNKTTLEADIALLSLVEHVEFTDVIKPICLKYQKNYSVGTQLYIAGYWGNNGTSYSIKQKGNVKIDEYKFLKYSLKDKIFCKSEMKTDTCPGDSGGPIMYESALKYYLVGVTSSGYKNCGEGGFYTNLGIYFDWILEIIISNKINNSSS